MKKERPILFSTPMVKAIDLGAKTKTRRTTKLEVINQRPEAYSLIGSEILNGKLIFKFNKHCGEGGVVDVVFPYGLIGDVLWVRECFRKIQCGYAYKANPGVIFKNQSMSFTEIDSSWKPSIHMPKRIARLWLEIINVTAEPLQKITDKEACLEGVETLEIISGFNISPKTKFEMLWNIINGESAFDENPWVWVIEFKQIKK